MLARYLNAWPQVRLQVQATNANVDVWEGGVDLAVRARAVGTPLPREETVRPLALSPHVLVATPRLLASAMPPTQPEHLTRLPTLGLGNSEDAQTWHLSGPQDEHAVVPHTPRLIADDMAALLDAALAGVGCAPLPRLLAHDALLRGDLQEALPGWAPRPGLVQVAFATRRGMRPAVRQLVDALAAGFDELVRQGRCLGVPPA
jgi:DNA-binding transcriptional LysR family regulator